MSAIVPKRTSADPDELRTPLWPALLDFNIQAGPIETNITSGLLDHLIERNLLQCAGKPEEVAGLAAHLTSADTGYMTGARITMDGGFST